MFLNNIKAFSCYIGISLILLCTFSPTMQEVVYDNFDYGFPFYFVAIVVSAIYVLVGFFVLNSRKEPAFLSVILIAIILEIIAIVCLAVEGRYPLDLIYGYTNFAYFGVLKFYSPLFIAPFLPSLFMYIGIVLRRCQEKRR